ncbi:MAG: hypothetical protein AB7F41_05505 [Methylocystis sp.]|uniref:hypothetical protein n=1 Tax=Methylocystis sp. TaxID=1911079 RepID=UPI003D0CCDBB
MKDAAEPLAVAVGRRQRRRAALRSVLRRANGADAVSERNSMRRRDRRLHEQKARDHRREDARAQIYPLEDWSHRRLSVPKPTLGFDRSRGQARDPTSAMRRNDALRLMQNKTARDESVFTFDCVTRSFDSTMI